MDKYKDITLNKSSTIRYTLEVIDYTAMQIALVVDQDGRLIGTVTDGDIRRGLLKGISLDDSISNVMYTQPLVAYLSDNKEIILEKAKGKGVRQIPIVDADYVLYGIQKIDDLESLPVKTNQAILMVGGLGTRLRPLTEHTPKPMLSVGNKPILQTIIEQFAQHGFKNITLCVNYKSDQIEDYFGDGKAFGVNIDYIYEDKRMGTAGALTLLSERPSEPFFVMNGDLLTNVNFDFLLDYHLKNDAYATMCVREYDFEVPFGVVKLEENRIKAIEEKPTQRFFVNAGIYMLSPEVMEHLPSGKYYDMPSLFHDLINQQKQVVSFPIREYWLDIGRMEELDKANNEYQEIF